MVITDSLKQWKKDLIKSQTKLKENQKEYNSVMKSKKDIYHHKQNIKIMSFQQQFEQVPEKLVKTLLRPKEVKKLQLLVDRGNYPLIAIVKSDDNDSRSSLGSSEGTSSGPSEGGPSEGGTTGDVGHVGGAGAGTR